MRSMNGAGALQPAEVEFLQAVAHSRDRPSRRRVAATASPACAPPVALLHNNTPEELLSLPPTSNLDIAKCGPRAAGKMLKRHLGAGHDRSVHTLYCPG